MFAVCEFENNLDNYYYKGTMADEKQFSTCHGMQS